jgi:16S rRNA (guanine966-N2)-methyltransferase
MRVRIAGGTFRGRKIQTPNGHVTHPMSDRAKQGLFNSLQDISGLRVFDPFGGSGAVSIEAISRGAAHAVCIDKDFTAAKIIANNVAELGLVSQITCVHANAASWSKQNSQEKFELIICEPPFDHMFHSERVIDQITHHLTREGLMIVSFPTKYETPRFRNMQLESTASYGEISLAYYRRAA